MLVLAAVCTGCSSSDDAPSVGAADPPGGVSFASVPVPTTDAAKRTVQASETVTIDGESHAIGYQVLMRSGDVIGGNTFGQVFDAEGNPVVETDGSAFISNDNDFSSLIKKGDRLFNITHFESRPGAMYLTELTQDTATGQLSPIATRSIDFAGFGGLWVPCAGSVTPWNTHLGSEEYPPDARSVEAAQSPDEIDDYFKPMLRYFGIADPFADEVTIEQIKATFNPYLGYPVEVALDDEGRETVSKRYAMGRIALELAYVMPDRKTVYLSDDGANVGFFMFVADAAGDLTAGTLYAARWTQTSEENGGSADISWIDLGHATQAQVRGVVNVGVGFSEIFESADPAEDGTCPAGFTSINTEPGQECLMVKPGMETIASRVETRRYAAMLGATTEFRKEEGITFDAANKRLYVAMSEVSRGMEDFKKGGEGTGSGHQNDAVWAFNIKSGDLTRIQTTPYGSETTSPYYYPDIDGWAYIMSVIQHPYGISDTDQLSDASDAAAYVGYIGPIPAMQ